ncbi:MAG: hypothetical protein AAFV19_08885 [Pseudomonadota bacterium]
MKPAAVLVAGALAAFAIPGCDEGESRPFALDDGTELTLLSLEAETKEVANGRTVGFLIASFRKPDGLQKSDRRPLAERLCPMVLAEMGAPEEIDGSKLETVLIKYITEKTFLGIPYGSSSNFWVELSRGECVTRG